MGDGAHAQITLVGRGAGALATQSPNATAHAFILHDSHNHEIRLTLGRFTPDPSDAGRAHATLSLEDPPVGAYSGELTLFPLAPTAPQLQLTVNSHLPEWCAFILVVIGAMLGGMALFEYSLNVRRETLLAALKEARDRVDEVRDKLGGQVDEVAGVTWYLDDLAAEGSPAASTNAKHSSAQGLPTGNLTGVDALRERIEEARNDRDLDEDNDAVFAVFARIQRWLRLAPAAWRLQMVTEEPQQDMPGWRQTRTWRDTRLLQERLLYEPSTPAAADELVAQVLWQIQWHHALTSIHAWTLQPAHVESHAQVHALDASLAKSGVFARTAAERDELDFELEQLREEIEAPKPGEPPNLPGLHVSWMATPNLFTGWATIDGTTLLRVRARASQRYKRRWRNPRRPGWGRVGGALGWSLLPVFAASAVYMVTIYNDTWGSFGDILTALSAGLVGKLAIDWASLPIFQSRRLRTPGPVASDTAKKATEAVKPPASAGR